MATPLYEVEQKFWVDALDELEAALRAIGATEQATEQHSDHYFNHPSRDFRQTKEALRIRRINDRAHITYKGPKLPGAVKARTEIEWCLSPGDTDGSKTAKLWEFLGFQSVAAVTKTRRPFLCESLGEDLSITIDAVDGVGLFSEIEIVVPSEDEIEAARGRVMEVAGRLGLQLAEPQSYLSLWLERANAPKT